jgi:hypothetical protein
VQRSVMPIGFFHIPIKCDVIDQRKNKCIHFDAKRPWTAQGERGTSGPCALRVHRQRPRPRKAEALVVPPDASALHGGFAAIPTRSVPGLRKGSEERADLAPFESTANAPGPERLKLWSFLPTLQHSMAASPQFRREASLDCARGARYERTLRLSYPPATATGTPHRGSKG